eukprot:7691832-Pyramimonas_sp.AAC.1
MTFSAPLGVRDCPCCAGSRVRERRGGGRPALLSVERPPPRRLWPAACPDGPSGSRRRCEVDRAVKSSPPFRAPCRPSGEGERAPSTSRRGCSSRAISAQLTPYAPRVGVGRISQGVQA